MFAISIIVLFRGFCTLVYIFGLHVLRESRWFEIGTICYEFCFLNLMRHDRVHTVGKNQEKTVFLRKVRKSQEKSGNFVKT